MPETPYTSNIAVGANPAQARWQLRGIPQGMKPLPHPARALLRDPYGLMLFMGLLALLCLVLDIGPIKSILMASRWGILGVLAVVGLAMSGEAFSKGLTAAHWWLLGLMGIGAASCTWSIDPVYSAERWFSFALLFFAVFIGPWGWLQRRQNLLLGAEILYLLALIVTVIAAFHLGGEGIVDRTSRATGAMGKATVAGGFAAVAIPVLLWKIRYSSGFPRRIAQCAVLVQAYLLFFSGARGALLASSGGLAALIWFNYRPWRPLVAVLLFFAVLFGAGGIVGLDMLPDYVVRRESLETATGRFDRLRAVMVAWKKRPLQGYGFGTGRLLIGYDSDAMDEFLGDDRTSNSSIRLLKAQARGIPIEIQPHNDHVERLAEVGVFGWLCFVGMWGSLLMCIPKLVRAGPGIVADLGRSLLAVMWFFLVDTMLHSGMFAAGNGTTIMNWYLMVVLLATTRLVSNSPRSAPIGRAMLVGQPVRPLTQPG